MPRAFFIPVERYGLLRTEKDGSPERSVRTAESSSRSPSPSRPHFSRANTSTTYRSPSPHFLRQHQSPLSEHTAHKKDVKTRLSPANLPFRDGDLRHSSIGDEEQNDQHWEDSRLDCPEELYNLTKLAEVSLAAAAGQLFRKRYCNSSDYEVWPEQEYPEDLSRDASEREEHACPECGKRYSTSSNLARHRQTHRSLADKKARRCPNCDKVYVSMPAFAMHMRTHNQGCRCSYCGKCFSRPWLLQGHIRTHTGEKPFKCTICSKAFADKSNLRAHIQTHSNMKPHVCGRCGKAFALKSYLYKHEESSCMKIPYSDVKIKPDSVKSSAVISISIQV